MHRKLKNKLNNNNSSSKINFNKKQKCKQHNNQVKLITNRLKK